jgi:hypothetical protein
MCLVIYRDHPPQDKSFVTRQFGFTSDANKIQEILENIRASGGGDGPEAVTSAMNVALNLEWYPNATKIIILIGTYYLVLIYYIYLCELIDLFCKSGCTTSRFG